MNENETKATPRFPVGTRYTPIGKNAVECTVTDYHVTRNLAGEIVRFGYVAAHLFCGQTVRQFDIPESTIARGNPIKP